MAGAQQHSGITTRGKEKIIGARRQREERGGSWKHMQKMDGPRTSDPLIPMPNETNALIIAGPALIRRRARRTLHIVSMNIVVGVVFGALVDSAVSAADARARLFHEEVVDDPILQRVHGQGEEEHGKGNLQGLVALGPPQRPVTDPRQPGQQGKQHPHAHFHAHQPESVKQQLLHPPRRPRRLAVPSRVQRLRRSSKWGVVSAGV